jgi:hypothetical protein
MAGGERCSSGALHYEGRFAYQYGLESGNINAAIVESNTQLANVVQWVPATANDSNLVNFSFTYQDDNGTCEAIVGMQGGSQPIGGAENCTVGTILQEMGHAPGLLP